MIKKGIKVWLFYLHWHFWGLKYYISHSCCLNFKFLIQTEVDSLLHPDSSTFGVVPWLDPKIKTPWLRVQRISFYRTREKSESGCQASWRKSKMTNPNLVGEPNLIWRKITNISRTQITFGEQKWDFANFIEFLSVGQNDQFFEFLPVYYFHCNPNIARERDLKIQPMGILYTVYIDSNFHFQISKIKIFGLSPRESFKISFSLSESKNIFLTSKIYHFVLLIKIKLFDEFRRV